MVPMLSVGRFDALQFSFSSTVDVIRRALWMVSSPFTEWNGERRW